MPWKDIEKRREAVRRHYYANKPKYIAKALRRKKEVKEWVNEVKSSSPCADCGVSYPYYVMDFDHVGEKKAEINMPINNTSVRTLEREIEHCELVCSNCHRIRTYNRITKVSDIL